MKIDELRVGNRVHMLSGQTAVVLGILPNKDRPYDDRVEIRYEGSDRKTWVYAHRVVAVVPSVVVEPEEAETNSTTIEQALELLRVEHKAAVDKIEELLKYRDTLVYAIDTLAEAGA